MDRPEGDSSWAMVSRRTPTFMGFTAQIPQLFLMESQEKSVVLAAEGGGKKLFFNMHREISTTKAYSPGKRTSLSRLEGGNTGLQPPPAPWLS